VQCSTDKWSGLESFGRSGLDGHTDAHVLRVPVQVPLPDHAAAASKGTPERKWTVRTERSKST
jgi:hypothetical protein